MKSRFLKGIAYVGVIALVFTSCAKVPQTEIDAANNAIEQAQAVGADEYAEGSFIALNDTFTSILVSIELQKSKFMKDYTGAKEQLLYVVQYAAEVEQQTVNRKEELAIEVENTIEEVKGLLTSNRTLIEMAPKGKEGATALEAIKAEVDAIESSINETSQLVESGNFLASFVKIRAAKEKAASINLELTDVIAKYKGKGRRA